MRTYRDIMGNQISGKTLQEVLTKLTATFPKEDGYSLTYPDIGRSISVFKHDVWQLNFTEFLGANDMLDLTPLATNLTTYGAELKDYYVHPKAPRHVDLTLKGVTERTLSQVKVLIESSGLHIASCIYLEKGSSMVPEMYPLYSIHAIDFTR